MMPIPSGSIPLDSERAEDCAATQNRTEGDEKRSIREIRPVAQPGDELATRSGRDRRTCDSVAVLAACWDTPAEPGDPAVPGSQDSEIRGASPEWSAPFPCGQSGKTAVPPSQPDRTVSQPDWERVYVPSYLLAAADLLYTYRDSVASEDAAVIDAAILRLFAPWITRHAAST